MIILLLSLLSSVNACTYQMDQVSISVGDRSVYFGDYLVQKLETKGYVRSFGNEPNQFEVNLNFSTYFKNRFDHAHSKVSLKNLKTENEYLREKSIICYTQICNVPDAAKAIKRSIDLFARDLLHCN
jgi:hypothetical protein